MNNDKLIKRFTDWYKKHITIVKSRDEEDFFTYALFYDGLLFAIGEKWGETEGDIASISFGGYDKIAETLQMFKEMPTEDINKKLPEYQYAVLADRIKDCHIISDALYNNMCKKAEEMNPNKLIDWYYYKIDNPHPYDIEKEITRWVSMHFIKGTNSLLNKEMLEWGEHIAKDFLKLGKQNIL